MNDIDLGVKYLCAGKAVVFPTDTAYGLGVDATNEKAVKRLFKIKQRRPQKPVHIVVSGLKMAKQYAVFTRAAEKLFKKFLPGALTLILPLRPPLHLPLMRGRKRGGQSAFRILSAGTNTIGIRMPKNAVALKLVKKLGRPITATSANTADAPTAYSISQINHQYKGKKLKPDLILDSGKLPKIRPSTMVRLDSNQVSVIRRGPITKKQIDRELITSN